MMSIVIIYRLKSPLPDASAKTGTRRASASKNISAVTKISKSVPMQDANRINGAWSGQNIVAT